MLTSEKIDNPRYEGHLMSTLNILEKGIFKLPDEPGGNLGQEWWRFRNKDNIVGYGWICEETSSQILEISFVVVTEYRKCKPSVGKYLVNHLEKVCKDKGASSVQAIVNTTNPYSESVIRLLCSLGYKSNLYDSIEELVKYSNDLKHTEGITILMHKDL